MKKLTAGDPASRSPDMIAENLERIKDLFPEAFTEGRIDFDVLRHLLGSAVDEREEKYGLNWHGKRQARQLALTPSTGTLRPCPEDSVDWDTTQNLMIEGDNLEVLKLLQKSYAGKVKLIYIDPPYNTGKDFIYPDNFRDNIRNYLELTAQVDGDNHRLSTNTETSGRFHTDWLNMMYPRLKLARNLLRKDGSIFLSIDDNEVANCRLMCDDIFGQENFVAEIIWEGANKNDARQIGVCHEYVLVYARLREQLERDWSIEKEGVDAVTKEVERLRSRHGNDYSSASRDLAAWFRSMKASPSFGLRRFRKIDANGAYKEDDPTAPGGRRFELRNPRTGDLIPLRANRGWGFDQMTFEDLVDKGRITFVTDSSIMVRRYLHETDKVTPPSVFYQPARSASERLGRLMGGYVFDFPKDETILAKFVEMATTPDDDQCIVLDFFAGSGATAHAVFYRNSFDSGSRRFILVQLPEPLDLEGRDQRESSKFCDQLGRSRNIAELTKERLRRTGAMIEGNESAVAGDIGFRVFKLDSSNFRVWEPDRDDLDGTLVNSIEHIKSGRTQEDLLYELLLRQGLDLCMPIETRVVGDRVVCSVGAGTLIACLTERIASDEVEQLGSGIADWHAELEPAGDTTVVFRDSAFSDDVAKTNLMAILEQRGLGNVRSL